MRSPPNCAIPGIPVTGGARGLEGAGPARAPEKRESTRRSPIDLYEKSEDMIYFVLRPSTIRIQRPPKPNRLIFLITMALAVSLLKSKGRGRGQTFVIVKTVLPFHGVISFHLTVYSMQKHEFHKPGEKTKTMFTDMPRDIQAEIIAQSNIGGMACFVSKPFSALAPTRIIRASTLTSVEQVEWAMEAGTFNRKDIGRF